MLFSLPGDVHAWPPSSRLFEGSRSPGAELLLLAWDLLAGILAVRRGVLDLGIHLGADEDRQSRHVKPGEHENHGTDGAVSGVVRSEFGDVELERQRNEQPTAAVGRHTIFPTLQHPKVVIGRSVWNTRGWTYQDRPDVGVDSAVFDPTSQYYYVASGGAESAKTHVVSIIDTKTFKQVGEIALPGNESEAMAIDKEGKKMYVSLRATNEVGVVDLGTRKGVARWPIPGASTANSLVLDEANHRVFIATRKPPKFFVFDTDTGKVVTSLPCAPLHDDMWFDRASKRIYVTGSETTTVLEQKDADHYTHLADDPTGFRAKTSILVPELNRIYIAVSGKGKADAKLALQVYELQP